VFAFNFFQPITDAMLGLLNAIHAVVPAYGLDMVLLALVVRLALFPLAQQQFKSMAEMQKVQPLLKKLQAEYKGKPQELQAATMALYKEHGVNPLAGCFPMLIQLPILLGLFYAIQEHVGCDPNDWKSLVAGGIKQCVVDGKATATAAPGDFWSQHFLWIGSALSQHYPQIFATSLATLDMGLFVLYVVSMYISVRYGSPPSSDPQQAQTQKIMAIMSPAMIAYFGWRYHWASALLIYWLTLNVLTMAQQFYMYRRYGLIGPKKVAVEPVEATVLTGAKTSNRPALAGGKNGSTSGRAARRSKR
jgi:YidC/Oxa1 family membrane protein insertase